MKPLVIIPTYNEKENITNIIDAVMGLSSSFHMLIVDDNSPDGTQNLVKDSINKYENRIHLLTRSGKLGLGSAYIAGFKYGLKKGYSHLFEMDADFSHPPQKLEELYSACKNGADISVGSRYIKDGDVKDWSWDRIILSRGASIYVQIITSMPVKDPTAGFVCYTDKVLRTIDLDKIGFVGYAFQIEMKYVFWKHGFKIKEVPIIFKDREFGVSKMNVSIIKEAILGVFKLRGRNIKEYYKN
ncbi:MAG: polyprenol monophosphomannose synthase [Saprospiraceae bacterium]